MATIDSFTHLLGLELVGYELAQFGNARLHNVPDELVIHAEVVMDKAVAHPSDLALLDLRM
jgi:hypothetical protein